jgi:phosphohistidine phosphatase
MGTLRLTLLRHAHAQPPTAGAEDFVRPLTARGRAEATEMGKRLAQAGLVPDLILASSAQRTQMTVQLLAAACSLSQGRIRYLDELYNATARRIWETALSNAGKSAHLLVCGHNPGISRLASGLGADPEALDLPPAGLFTGLWHHDGWKSLRMAEATELQHLRPAAQR